MKERKRDNTIVIKSKEIIQFFIKESLIKKKEINSRAKKKNNLYKK
jgi:hypothetical protein